MARCVITRTYGFNEKIAGKSNRFLQVLSEPRKFWIRDTTNKIYSVLSDTPPEGDKFVQHIKSILKYEEKWSKWKNEGCPALSKLPDKVISVFGLHS